MPNKRKGGGSTMDSIHALGKMIKSEVKAMTRPCDFEVHLEPEGTLGCGMVVIDKESMLKTFRPEVCTLTGSVTIRVKKNHVVEYEEASIAYVGTLVTLEGVVARRERFLNIRQHLSDAGSISDSKCFNFTFENVRSPFDSYKGSRVTVKYALRIKLKRSMMAFDVTNDEEIWIRCQRPQMDAALCPSLLVAQNDESSSLWNKPYGTNNYEERPFVQAQHGYGNIVEYQNHALPPVAVDCNLNDSDNEDDDNDVPPPPLAVKAQSAPKPSPVIKRMPPPPPPDYNVVERPIDITVVLDTRMKLGLFIERNVYHTRDIIKGRMCFEELNGFELVVAKLQIVRKEQYCNKELSNEVLFTSELLDGDPPLHVPIPLSLPLRGITSLSPTCLKIHNKANMRFFLRLLLFDEGQLPYTAESEINIWRQPEA